jgi:hypothetical protein
MTTNAIRRWLHTLTGRRQHKSGNRHRRGRCGPRVRQLEDRTVPTTFNIGNGDVQGLINAITTANSDGQVDLINLAPNGSYSFTQANNNTSGPNVLPPIASHNLTIEGNNSVLDASGSGARFLYIEAGVKLVLQDMTLRHGIAVGALDKGGAIFDAASNLTVGKVNIASCSAVWTSASQRTAASAGQNGGVAADGGSAQGGGIYSLSGQLTLVQCNINARAAGGNGGQGLVGGRGGNGGSASGGGVYLKGGQANFSNCTFGGSARGGLGGVASGSVNGSQTHFGQGGAGGAAAGGGLYSNGATVILQNAHFNSALAIGGAGGGAPGVSGLRAPKLGVAGAGGRGGDAQGGGLYAGGGSMAVFNSNFAGCAAFAGNGGAANGATGAPGLPGPYFTSQHGAFTLRGQNGWPGGSGGTGGAGGDGAGGGLYASGAIFTLNQSSFQGDTAAGGAGGSAMGAAGGHGGTGANASVGGPGSGGRGGNGGGPGGHVFNGVGGGSGGTGQGGGLYLNGASLGLCEDSIAGNRAIGGPGGQAGGGFGGTGGPGGSGGPYGSTGSPGPGGPGGTGGAGGDASFAHGGAGGDAQGGGLFVASGSTAVVCSVTVRANSASAGGGGSAPGGAGGAGGAGGFRSGQNGASGPAGPSGTSGSAGTSQGADTEGATLVPLSCLGAITSLSSLTALEGWSSGKIHLATFSGGPTETSANAYDAIVFWGDGTSDGAGAKHANVWLTLDSAGNVEVLGRHMYAVVPPGAPTPSPQPIMVALWVPGQDAAEVIIPVSVAANVTDQVQTSSTTPTVNRATGLYTGTITFTNPAGAPNITGQFDVLLAHLPQGVSVRSAVVTIGTAQYRVAVNRDNPLAPFLEIPAADLSDLTGGESITLNVTFKDPLGTAIVFAPGLFAGPLPAVP